MPHLTDIVVRNLEHRPKQYDVMDDVVTGFGVRVGPKSKRFFVYFRTPVGKRRVTLPNLTLAEARKAARKILAENTLERTLPKLSDDDYEDRIVSSLMRYYSSANDREANRQKFMPKLSHALIDEEVKPIPKADKSTPRKKGKMY